MKPKYTMDARATIITDDGCDYDLGIGFHYEDEEGFEAGVKALTDLIFSKSNYIVYDSMGANVIPINRIVTIRVEKGIPTV